MHGNSYHRKGDDEHGRVKDHCFQLFAPISDQMVEGTASCKGRAAPSSTEQEPLQPPQPRSSVKGMLVGGPVPHVGSFHRRRKE